MTDRKRSDRIRVLHAECELHADQTAHPMWMMLVRVFELLKGIEARLTKVEGKNE